MIVSLKGGIVASRRGWEFVVGEQEAVLASSSEVRGIVRPKPDQRSLALRLPRAAMLPLPPDATARYQRVCIC
jgi:hypothetical protein